MTGSRSAAAGPRAARGLPHPSRGFEDSWYYATARGLVGQREIVVGSLADVDKLPDPNGRTACGPAQDHQRRCQIVQPHGGTLGGGLEV